jgi:cytochrome c oxidase subunit II
MSSSTRRLLLSLGGLALAGAAAAGAIAVAAAPEEKVITVAAMKFDFLPSTITLKKGEPVILELSSIDRAHGFKVPDLGIRADVLPDTAVRVRIVPDKVGRFTFACDNFCGEGHEDMEGVIVVDE